MVKGSQGRNLEAGTEEEAMEELLTGFLSYIYQNRPQIHLPGDSGTPSGYIN